MATVRVGEISFINALPLAFPLARIADVGIEKVSLPPTGLNQAMKNCDLEVSPVSSAFYLRNQAQFVMLEGLSISAETPVESVIAALPQGFEGLTADSLIAVPNTSETSIALLQYLLYLQTGIKFTHQLQVYSVGEAVHCVEQGLATLAIGDEALLLRTRCHPSLPVYDLAELWQAETALPFVFAVWVAQRDWAEANPDLLTHINGIYSSEKDCFYQSRARQIERIELAHQRCPHLSRPLLEHYFCSALSYNLDEAHQSALLWFNRILEWLDDDGKPFPQRDRTQLSLELLHR